MKHELTNKNCAVEYREDDKEIFARDLTDHYNEPAMYTKTKRGLRNVWAALVLAWNENITMHDVIELCREYGIRTHYWCMVD